MKTAIKYVLTLGLSLFFITCHQTAEVGSIKDECLTTLYQLTDALYKLQIDNEADENYGALRCENCNVLHTRAAETVYPFAVAYKNSGDVKYLHAAKCLGNWLIKQQLDDGSWKETPEEWTGTTTDQLLMMVMARQLLKENLSDDENRAWKKAIISAADYLTAEMSPDFASINYCATTTASLALTNKYFPDKKYDLKSRMLAHQVLSNMDEDGFINAEGGRAYGAKYGADVGYEIDMSLWGLAIYGRLSGDKDVEEAVRKSLKNHLYFVYPNGAIDGSWGIRSNKWTTYGSLTADGCQILFSLFSGEDPRYRTAALSNLTYLKTMIKDGLLTYGPDYATIFNHPPCIYPTFARSKNLAMAAEWGDQKSGPVPALPTQELGWVKVFPTMNVALVRSKNFMTTISGYGYQDLRKTYKSKYMHRPAGGSITNLWVKDYGFLQLGGQTAYHRWEPMSFPDVSGMRCISPRIEFQNENGYFSNLYEFDVQMEVSENVNGAVAMVKSKGELSDKNLLPGGVAYTLTHSIYDDFLEKDVSLRYHDGARQVTIVEPIIWHEEMKIIAQSENAVKIIADKKVFIFEVLEGDVDIALGENQSEYFSVYPSVRAYPIELNVAYKEGVLIQKIRYQIRIEHRESHL